MEEYSVYLIRENGIIRYAGESKNVFGRHGRKHKHIYYRGNKRQSAIPEDVDLSTIEFEIVDSFPTEREAKTLEGSLIDKYDLINNGWNVNRSDYVSEDPEYQLKWRQEHKDYQKEWLKTHQDYHKNWEETHREQRNKAKKERYHKNKEKINARRRELRQLKKEMGL